MRTKLECIPCSFQLIANSCQLLGLPEAVAKKMMDELGSHLSEHPLSLTPPELSIIIQQNLVHYSKMRDPYYSIKRKSNKSALSIIESLRSLVKESDDPLKSSVAFACAGNIIDFGISNHHVDIEKEIANILEMEGELLHTTEPHLFEIERFAKDLTKAKKLLFVGDNAGEIVFDKILLETINSLYPDVELSYAVRGKPIFNDALLEDAHECGIDRVATILDSGVDTPGLVLKRASEQFLSLYEGFDLIIAKGQGNFEALSETSGPIYFLLITKCDAVAQELGSSIRQIILTKHQG